MPCSKLVADLESALSPADSWFTAVPSSIVKLPFEYGTTAVQMQTHSFSPTFCIPPPHHQRKSTHVLNILKCEDSGVFPINTFLKKNAH